MTNVYTRLLQQCTTFLNVAYAQSPSSTVPRVQITQHTLCTK